MRKKVGWQIPFRQMVSLSWIMHALVMLCHLTPLFKLISLKCFLHHLLEQYFFCVALIFSETIESSVWLFKTFLTAISGKHPSTIFINQDTAMAGAIAMVNSTKQSMIMSLSKFKTAKAIWSNFEGKLCSG